MRKKLKQKIQKEMKDRNIEDMDNLELPDSRNPAKKSREERRLLWEQRNIPRRGENNKIKPKRLTLSDDYGNRVTFLAGQITAYESGYEGKGDFRVRIDCKSKSTNLERLVVLFFTTITNAEIAWSKLEHFYYG